MNNEPEYHLPTDETVQRAAEALEKIAAKINPPQPEQPVVEYGVRWLKGASVSTLERVTRQNGVIAKWEIDLPQNVGETAEHNPFDDIDLFSTKKVADAAGNQFRRFKRFYYGEEQIGAYSYIWVCSKPLYAFYRLPRAFYRDGAPYWNFVDYGVFEGGDEVIDGQHYLASKPGFAPVVSINRTTAHNRAKAWEQKLEADSDQVCYDIDTMSPLTEILQPLLLIMFGTRNSQDIYRGVSDVCTDDYENEVSETDVNRFLINNTPENIAQFPVGCCVYYGDSWRVIENVGTATVSGKQYLELTVSGEPFNTTAHDECFWRGPNATGETDKIAASNGTLNNDGTHSFKALGIENIYGNVWKHVLDCTIYQRKPYVCENLEDWTDTTTPATNPAFVSCGYTLPNSGWIKELQRSEEHPDVCLPKTTGGSDATYFGDYVWVGTGTTTAYTVFYGGVCAYGSYDGLACWYLDSGVGYSNDILGARLSRKSL